MWRAPIHAIFTISQPPKAKNKPTPTATQKSVQRWDKRRDLTVVTGKFFITRYVKPLSSICC